jgi:hypothetical protein
LLGETDRARLANALESGSDIDAVAHQIAVALLDNVPQVDADAKFDTLFRRQASVALDHSGLNFDRAPHRIDHAAELDDCAVAGALHNATVVHRDDGVDEIAAKGPQARENALFVCPGEPTIADHVGHQNSRELPGLARCTPPAVRRLAQKLSTQCRATLGAGKGRVGSSTYLRVGVCSSPSAKDRFIAFSARS